MVLIIHILVVFNWSLHTWLVLFGDSLHNSRIREPLVNMQNSRLNVYLSPDRVSVPSERRILGMGWSLSYTYYATPVIPTPRRYELLFFKVDPAFVP